MPQRNLILASASPRRQELLREARYPYICRPADIDESIYPAHLSPGELAGYLSRQKALVVAEMYPDDIILAADTVVTLAGEVFGKPIDRDDARRMLSKLSGTVHQVVTGVTVASPIDVADGSPHDLETRTAESAVHMRTLSPSEIETYVAGGQWLGKAGGYGIQDPDPFVIRIDGSLSSIVGLPMELAAEMLARAGVFPRVSECPAN